MKPRKFLFFVVVFWCCSCAGPETESQQTTEEQADTRPDGIAIPVVLARVQVKEQPNAQSQTLNVLQAGDSLYLTGEVSSHRSRLTMGGRTYERAWLFCKTATGAAGWVHGAAVPDGLPRELQLRSYFETPMAESCLQYITTYESSSAEASVMNALRQAHQLSQALSQHPKLQTSLPEGLSRLLPGLQATWLEDQQRFGWYVNYKAFLDQARASPLVEDEQLLELYYLAYPLDSIGYRFPDWMLEAAPGEAYSLLGRGKHLTFLEALSQRSATAKQITPELQELQRMLLNDIKRSDVAFWEKRELVLQELQELTAHPALDASTRGKLTVQLKAWSADSLPPQVTFNHRAGLHTHEAAHEN